MNLFPTGIELQCGLAIQGMSESGKWESTVSKNRSEFSLARSMKLQHSFSPKLCPLIGYVNLFPTALSCSAVLSMRQLCAEGFVRPGIVSERALFLNGH